MSKLTVVIIGSSASGDFEETKMGNTPNFENIDESLEIAEINKTVLNIIFVDPMYYRLKFVEETSSDVLKDESILVDRLKKYQECVFIEDYYYRSKLNFNEPFIKPQESSQKEQEKEESEEEEEEEDEQPVEKVIFVSFVKSVKNTYQFMQFVESYETKNKFFVIPNDTVNKFNLSGLLLTIIIMN